MYFIWIFLLFSCFYSVEALSESPDLKELESEVSISEESALNDSQTHKINRDREDHLGSLSSMMVLAQAYQKKGDYKNAVRVLRKLKNKGGMSVKEMIDLAKAFGSVYFNTGDFTHRQDSLDLLNQALEKNHKKYNESIQIEMLKLLKFKADGADNNYEILQLVKKLIRDFGEKPHYVSDLCQYLLLNKFHKQGISACRKAIQKNPKAPNNYVYYAWSFEENKKVENHLKAAGKKFPDSYFVQLKIGQFYLEQEDYDKAGSYYKKAAVLNPNSAAAQVGLARVLFNTKKEQESYKYFLQACLLNKTDTLWSFQQAKSILNQRSKFKLASKFEKGITKCFLQAKN